MATLTFRSCSLRGAPFKPSLRQAARALPACRPTLHQRDHLQRSAQAPITASAPAPNNVVLESSALIAALAAGCLLTASGADAAEAASPATVQAARIATDILRPLFNLFTILYIVRVPMTWFPDFDGSKMPWAIAYVPTEPTLAATRKVIPLVSGVDISPIVWVGIISFLSEILLGPQGLLTLVQARGGL